MVAQCLIVEGASEIAFRSVVASPNVLWVVESIDGRSNNLTGAAIEDSRNFVRESSLSSRINTVDCDARRVCQSPAHNGRCEFANDIGTIHERDAQRNGANRRPAAAGAAPRLGRDFDVLHRARRGRDRVTIFTHALEMKLDGFTNLSLHFVDGGTGSYATREIRDIGREVRPRIFDNDGIAHDSPHLLKPACLRMLFSVPGASSSLGFPGTVTRPDFVGCLN